MIHLSEQVKLAEFEIQQVIVKSYAQHTYLEEGWNLLNLNLMQTRHFRLKFFLKTLYFHVFRWKHGKTLTFCEIKFGEKNTPTY